MGFADTGKLGVAVRPRVYSDRLPKNVAQPGLEGKKLFQIGGVNPTIFNLDAALHARARGARSRRRARARASPGVAGLRRASFALERALVWFLVALAPLVPTELKKEALKRLRIHRK